MMTRKIQICISVLGLLLGGIEAQAATPAPATGIRVLARGVHYGGNLVYSYKVINNSGTPFNNFTIGSEFDSVEDDEFPQLTRLPLGWKYGITGEVGTEIILAPGSTSQPLYWNATVYGKQDDSKYFLEWLAVRGPDDVSKAIQPGQSLTGFNVTIPPSDNKLVLPRVTGQPLFTGPDPMYIKGNFKVGYGSSKKFQEVWGTLEREDTTPPALSVSLSPTILPPNNKHVPITATITVKDDFDPAPEIQLISITANEPLNNEDGRDIQPGTDDRQFMLKAKRKDHNKDGRIYTVTYTATDGTGNIATASATVTVPHEHKEHEEHREERNKKDKDERKRDH